jgi:hypothetical protein
VDELGVGRHGQHLAVTVGKLLVQIAETLDLGRADEGEVLRVEENELPLALVRLVGDVDERVFDLVRERAAVDSLEVELGELIANAQHV